MDTGLSWHSLFAKITRQEVIGALNATGSRDAGVLFAAKQSLLAPAKRLNGMGLCSYIIGGLAGGLATVLVLTPVIGIPLIVFGWWARRRASLNIGTIEAAFSAYAAAVFDSNITVPIDSGRHLHGRRRSLPANAWRPT